MSKHQRRPQPKNLCTLKKNFLFSKVGSKIGKGKKIERFGAFKLMKKKTCLDDLTINTKSSKEFKVAGFRKAKIVLCRLLL